jgi:hypothetical protein
MIFSVDFGEAQSNVGYQFLDIAGNLLGSHSTAVSVGSQPGMYFVQTTTPGNATAIIWDCADVALIARDDFQELARLEGFLGQSVATPIVVDAQLQIPGSLAEELDADLGDAIASYEQSFTWSGRPIACVINLRISKLLTLKSYFGAAGARNYPKCGQTLVIAGAKYQITRKGNAELKAVTGGFIEDPAFIDDPTDPSLEIEYARFVRH